MNIKALGLIIIHMLNLKHQVKGRQIVAMKDLTTALRKEARITCWELKSHPFKALVLSAFTMVMRFGEVT